MTSYGDHVPWPSVALIHASGSPSSNAVRVAGVRSRIAKASSKLNGSCFINVILLALGSEGLANCSRVTATSNILCHSYNMPYYPVDHFRTLLIYGNEDKTSLTGDRGCARSRTPIFAKVDSSLGV